jgi:hypothetical protein
VDDSPIVFVLADQCFPPVLPPETDGECIKILRIEDGGVVELLNAFLEATKGFRIPAGTVIVIFSASRLSAIGTEAYATEFAEARFRLQRVVGDGIEMLHGFPILYTGTGNRALIKSILDLEHWVTSCAKGRDIGKSRKHCIKLTLGNTLEHFSAGNSQCTGTPVATVPASSADTPVASAIFPTRMMLPTLMKYGEKAIYESPIYVDIPLVIDAVSEVDERNMIDQLIQELNTSFMTELAECTVEREAEYSSEHSEALYGKRIVMIGASHTARLANAMEDMGAVVVDLSIPGWRITGDNVSSQVQQLTSVLSEEYEGETYIIYQLFDNSVFFSSNDDIQELPYRGQDGKYHVPGKLVLADRDEFKRLFTEILPLLRSGLDHKKFILSPLLRYTVRACCRDPDHLTNKRDGDFLQNQVSSLTEIFSWLSAMAFTRRIRNFSVINPLELLGPEDDIVGFALAVSQYYKEDPVHLTGAGYADLCSQLVDRMSSEPLKRKTTGESKQLQPQQQIDWAARRSKWVRENDSDVHRADTGNARGRGYRGRGRWPRRARGGKFSGWGRGQRAGPY